MFRRFSDMLDERDIDVVDIATCSIDHVNHALMSLEKGFWTLLETPLALTFDDAQVLREGLELIFKKFLKILEGEGVERIETEGKDFDTDYHEAIAMVPGMGDDKKGKVIDCVQTGYTLNGKVIRFAKVAVGQ